MLHKSVSLGDKIEVIKKTGFKSNEHSLFSMVQEIVSEDVLVISAPIESGKVIPLELGLEYYLCIYTSTGLYRCEAAVIDRKHVDRIYLATLQLKTKMQKYQRRQYYRLDCLLSFHYKNDNIEEWTEGTILDISGGGMRFTSKKQLLLDESLVCKIQLNFEGEKKTLFINGSIVGSSVIDYHTNLYETRVSFDLISNEDREMIIRFIFEEERKRRKKEKGM